MALLQAQLLCLGHAARSAVKPTMGASTSAARSLEVPPSYQRVNRLNEMEVLMPPGAEQAHHALGVLPLSSERWADRVVGTLREPSFPWTTDRHSNHATTDCEVYSIPWLEAEMAAMLRQSILPAIAALYEVDEADLFLRDQFVVKYSSVSGCQSSLETHYDESCFSYVVQLNDPSEFVGGGTLVERAAEAISVPQGHALLFCGYNRHSGAPVTGGERYILTGFVDFRASVGEVRPFYGDLPGALPMPFGAGSNDFPSPQLTLNLRRLTEAYGGVHGDSLLRSIAYSPPALGPHVDLSQLQRRCAGYLERGAVPSERFYAFLQAVVGQSGGAEGGRDGGSAGGGEGRRDPGASVPRDESKSFGLR